MKSRSVEVEKPGHFYAICAFCELILQVLLAQKDHFLFIWQLYSRVFWYLQALALTTFDLASSPAPFPVFQRCTLKSVRAWYVMSCAWCLGAKGGEG